MPMNRYEIRNEYSLADPELYRAADKDDPEELLEGVAMAGLVGVLRQLGDLAEFAAEIFHDLHEEVMATAARGHSLMIRVQQLEADVPFIEKAFLAQTDHSSSFYNAGVDWHPSIRMDQNLVTQGDLPRFIMDSYEECRGPPRLFLLDKFDVAGAGACLKRYTDPSFFKVETSAMADADVQREKKIRKAKRKGPRGKYGETPEFLPASHAQLHQLFLEEPVETGVKKPAHRAKLKRRQNGFPFDLKTRNSYMEKLLTPSPEHKMLHEITASSPLLSLTNHHNESDLDVLEVRSVSPARESEGRKINPPPPDKEDNMLNPPMTQTNDESTDIRICDVPSYLNIVTDGIPSTFDEENGEKEITIYGESKTDGSLTGYQSDDIASEIDNYVDAPSTMESEMDTDSELRMKNDFTSSYVKRRPLLSVRTRKRLHSQSSDSQSTGDLTISDEGSNSCKKEVSSFLSSDSPRTSADNAQSEKLSPEGFPSAEIPEIAVVNASSYQKTTDEDFPADGLPEPVVSNSTFPAKDAVRNNRPDSEQLTSDLCSTSSIPTLPHYDSGEVVRNGRLFGPKSDGTASTSDDEGNKTNLIIDSPNSRSVSHSKSLSGDDSPRSLSGERLVDGEDAPCMSSAAHTICHTSDSSAASAYLLHEDDNDQEDINQFGDTTSTLNMNNVLSQNEIISNESSTLGKLDNEVTKLPNNFASDYSDTVHNGDNITLKVLEGEKQNDDLYNEDSNVVSDAPNHFSCIMEASVGKEFTETSLTNAETVDSEDHYSNILIVNEISSETLISSGIGDSSDFLESGLDAYETDFPVEAITINGIPELGAPKSCEVLGLQGTGMTDDVTPNDLVAPESSFCMPQNLEDSAGTSYAAENDGIDPDSGVTGQELTEIPSSADPKLLSEVHVVLNESDSKTDQSETAVMASPVPAGSDNSIRNASLPADLDKLVEEHIPCSEDSGLSELENDKTSLSGGNRESELVEEDENYLSGSHRELGSIEKVDEREAARLHFQRVCNAENIDYPESEVPQTVLNSYLDSEVEHSVDFVDAAQIQSHLEQSGLDTDKTSFKQSGVENQVCDANSFPIDCVTEETKLQEKTELPPNRIDHELPDSGEISSELSSLPVNHQQMLDHDNDNGHDNFACSIPLGNSPPSVSGLPGLRNYGIDVSAYPKGPLGSIFPPSNVFPVTNQINLDELPPLPPLPPLQWRMGKLQHASSTTEVDKIEHKEVFSHEILPPATATGNVNSSLEQVNHSPIQNVPEITLKEANAEHGSASLEANSMHETINLPPKIENEQQQQLVMPTQESEVTLLAEEDLPPKIENMDQQQQQQLVMPSQENGVTSPAEEGLPPQIEKEQQQLLVMPGQESGVTSPAEEGLPPKIGKEQQQLVMPTQESEVTLPAEEDLAPKIENEDQQQQLVLPRQESGVVSQAEEGLPPKIENEQQQQLLVMPSQESGVTSPAEEGPPPKIGNEQRQLVMPTQESGVTLPAGEDLAPKIENEDQHQQLVMPRQESGVTSPAGEGLPPTVENEEQQEQLVLPSQESGVTSPAEEGLPPKIENAEQQQQLVLPTQGSEVKPPAKEDIPPKIENKQQQQQLFMPTQESETSPAEDGVASGSRSMKLPQTCNPVIGSVAALDKSKLRKVTERVRPQIPKPDERDSLLEQIRAKSFNLKPAVASRPSTQRPQNNLNVAAILEKANAIRQALAGSDEDDEDNWSDS